MDQLKAMKACIAVAQTGGFAKAAQTLGISAPSVTRLVSDLELNLGITLFRRTTRTVSLTETGQHYLRSARQIISDIEIMDATAKGDKETPRGHLRITASVLFGELYINPIIREFLNLYPEVSIEAVYMDRASSVVEEEFDLAIRLGHLKDMSLKAIRVGEVSWVVVGNPDYFKKNGVIKRPNDLSRHAIIAYNSSARIVSWRFKDSIEINLTPRLSCSTVSACIKNAISAWGVTRVLSYQVSNDLNEGRLQQVLADYEKPPIPIHVVHNETNLSAAKITRFKELLVTRLRERKFD